MPQITLKAARHNVNMTQKEAADAIGVSVATIKNWESGKTFPSQPKIMRICEIYGVSYDNIFFG